jgi:tRNA threonylcarbamoyladenosine biosynthesis protein TsaB
MLHTRSRMRILAIETSSRRGSVALSQADGDALVLEHEVPNAHAERMLALVAQALAEAGWSRKSLDRIAVGCGPGSFVGLRAGIALAEGLGLGLDRPVVGVGSLDALLWEARACPETVHIALLDARRDELFVAADTQGQRVLAPSAVPRAEVPALLDSFATSIALVGEAAALVGRAATVSHRESHLPHARSVAALGRALDPAASPARPLYVRDAGATAQELPPSPFARSS